MERAFIEFSIEKLQQLAGRIEVCLDRLNEDQIWMRQADAQNAIGNLVLHLCGNVRQWIISSIGGAPDTRERDAEFAARGGMPAADLKARLRSTIDEASITLLGLAPERLSQVVKIQDYERTTMVAIYHVVEHFSHHAGQIIFATKLFTGEDLGFYRHLQDPRSHTEKTP